MDWLGKALSETLIRQCLDQVPGAHYIVDCDCRLKHWSTAAERFTGYPADRMVDEWCREAWPPRCNQKDESFCGE
jgi:PAS domain S-box-containing protein